MTSSRGFPLGNLPPYTKFVLSLLFDLTILCYLVYSNYRLDACLPALRVYSLAFIVVEVILKFCTGPANTSPILQSRGKNKNKSSKITDAFLIIVLGFCSVLFIHVVTVLYGAYLIENVEETLTFSILVASLALIRPLITLGPKAFQILLERLNLEEQLDLQCIAVFLGAWLGALPIPLDWDTPWQVWPLTCCIGAILGDLITSLYLLTGLVSTESGRHKNKAT